MNPADGQQMSSRAENPSSDIPPTIAEELLKTIQNPCLTLFEEACRRYGTYESYRAPLVQDGQPDQRCRKLNPTKAGLEGRMEYFAPPNGPSKILIWSPGLAGCERLEHGQKLNAENAAYVLSMNISPPSFRVDAKEKPGGVMPAIFTFLATYGYELFAPFSAQAAAANA